MKMKGQTNLSIDRNFVLFIIVILLAGMLIYAYFAFFSSNNENIKTVENEDSINDESRICAQVITPAVSPNGECIEFASPCDVPEGWSKTDNCKKELPKEPINSTSVNISSVPAINAKPIE